MSGRKVFTAGEVLQAADVNDFLMDQSVMVFAGTAARGSAIPSPSEGMVTYLADADVVEVFNGSSFGPIGTILQVVSTTKTDLFSTTSATLTDVTGLTVTITPSSATSKVFVMVSLALNASVIERAAIGALLEDSTIIGGTPSGSRPAGTFYINKSSNARDGFSPLNFMTLRSPATTSALTYKVQVRSQLTDSTTFVNASGEDADNAARPRLASSITVMEVAG